MFAIRLLSETDPDTSLAWLLVLALGLFFLIVVIGWAVGRRDGS